MQRLSGHNHRIGLRPECDRLDNSSHKRQTSSSRVTRVSPTLLPAADNSLFVATVPEQLFPTTFLNCVVCEIYSHLFHPENYRLFVPLCVSGNRTQRYFRKKIWKSCGNLIELVVGVQEVQEARVCARSTATAVPGERQRQWKWIFREETRFGHGSIRERAEQGGGFVRGR